MSKNEDKKAETKADAPEWYADYEKGKSVAAIADDLGVDTHEVLAIIQTVQSKG